MAYTIDFLDDTTLVWELTPDGAVARSRPDYTPTFYVGDPVTDLYGPGDLPRREGLSPALTELRAFLAGQERVAETDVVTRRQTWRTGPRPVLRVDATHVDHVRPLATTVQQFGDPGAYTCYDVDLTHEYRYCLETATDPSPSRELRVLRLRHPRHDLETAALPQLTVDGDRIGQSPPAVLAELNRRLDSRDPDVLRVNTADVVPFLFEAAADYGVDLQLGRRPGYQQLAGASTYSSYGQLGHSPARYNVPGRVIIDGSNTFFERETNLAGCRDLVTRSWKPLQELAWASIGNVLTAIQIRTARLHDVLVPWQPWRPEFHSPAGTLAAADRGGVTFASDPGVHEDVRELDFASLYPNIMITRNISPETVECDCCDGADVPGLDYTICSRDGYLPAVLRGLVEDRTAVKNALDMVADPDHRARLEGRASALKWILVSCFGYQGFSNAKFGRIECHEAINAYARELLLDAKTTLETHGWRVVHGIVDSLWVQPRPDADPTPLSEVAAEITAAAGIPLEHETTYDWLAFCPLRDADAGALTKYFGRRRDGTYTYRGIECRQRSTPSFVAEAQRDLIESFDRTRDPEAVCDRLATRLDTLRDGGVDPAALTIDNRVSRPVGDYQQDTRTHAAASRAAAADRAVRPGQHVAYVVVDDTASGQARVALPHDSPSTYDEEFYSDLLVRAAASVLAPVGWRGDAIRAYLEGGRTPGLDAFRADP